MKFIRLLVALSVSRLPEQVRALAEVLAGQSDALTIADIEARFKG